jgi:5'-deoxynucleotidase YfbR-like HD superfamily hydrolase
MICQYRQQHLKKDFNMDIFDAPKNCIRTNSGLYINVFEPKSEMINIEDIAHALASLPRFGGHLNKHYSVAQHCVRCCEMAEGFEDKKAALLHDASEAYMLDIPTPIKSMLPDYKKYEGNLMMFIANHFDFEYPLNEKVHTIDRDMLVYEWENLVVNESEEFECWDHATAKSRFIDEFNNLFK